jgi:hypothetical protein
MRVPTAGRASAFSLALVAMLAYPSASAADKKPRGLFYSVATGQPGVEAPFDLQAPPKSRAVIEFISCAVQVSTGSRLSVRLDLGPVGTVLRQHFVLVATRGFDLNFGLDTYIGSQALLAYLDPGETAGLTVFSATPLTGTVACTMSGHFIDSP